MTNAKPAVGSSGATNPLRPTRYISQLREGLGYLLPVERPAKRVRHAPLDLSEVPEPGLPVVEEPPIRWLRLHLVWPRAEFGEMTP